MQVPLDWAPLSSVLRLHLYRAGSFLRGVTTLSHPLAIPDRARTHEAKAPDPPPQAARSAGESSQQGYPRLLAEQFSAPSSVSLAPPAPWIVHWLRHAL